MSFGNPKTADAYFVEQEAKQREKLRQRMEKQAAELHRKRELAEKTGVGDAAIVDHLHALGLDGEVAPAIHLLPLVKVAWADGSVSEQERRSVMNAAQAAGIEPGSKAGTFIASLLEKKPSDVLLDEVMLVLKELLAAKGMHPDNLVELCRDVATASGGFLGMGIGSKVSGDEAKAIENIMARLKPETQQKVQDAIKRGLA